jgi:hypothetical protein
MKMKKLKKIFSIALASAMALSLFAIPVSADENTEEDKSTVSAVGTPDNPAQSITVTKKLKVTTPGTLLPTEKFTFTMVPADAADLVTTTTEGETTKTTPITDSNGTKIEVGPALKEPSMEITFNDKDSTSTGSVEKSDTFDFDFNGSFDHTGVYRYYITESVPDLGYKKDDEGKDLTDADGNKIKETSNGYITYDFTKYIVDIYVNYNSKGELVAYNYTLKQDGASAKPQNVTFTNELNCATLKIMKLVDGEEYTKDELFTFRILIPVGGTTIKLEQGETITAKIMNDNGEVKDSRTNNTGIVNIVVNGENINAKMSEFATTFQLKKDEWLQIEGAPVSMIYKVEEVVDDASVNASQKSLIDEGYTTTYEYKELGDNAFTTAGHLTKVSGNVKQGTINTDTNLLIFTNSRTVDVGTGINLDLMPYVLITLIAVCGGVLLVVRKRRVDR